MIERIEKVREVIDDLNGAGIRRTVFFSIVAESLRRTEGEPLPIRRAKAFADLLARVDTPVYPHELLLGSIQGSWPLAEGLPDFPQRRREAIEVIDRFLADRREGRSRVPYCRNMFFRDYYDANIPNDQLERLKAEMLDRHAGSGELSAREVHAVLLEHFQFDYGEDRRIVEDLPWKALNHLDLNFAKAIRVGLPALRDRAAEGLADPPDEEARLFYESVVIAMDAVLAFTERYAGAALAHREHASVTAERAAELTEMARLCRGLAAGPPGSFRQGVQLVWMLNVIANLQGGSAVSFARLDQALGELYERDLAAGTLSRDRAGELLGCLWLKANEPHSRVVQSVCLGGLTPEGVEGSSDLTRLCLEVTRAARQPYPNVALRVGKDTPDWLWDEAVRTIQCGQGHPMLLNDDTWVPNRIRLGYTPEAARDYYNMGCVEIMTQGCMARWVGVGAVEMGRLVEELFDEEDLQRFETFEQLFDAYCARVRARVRELQDRMEGIEERRRGLDYDPYGSALIDDCLDTGRDMYQGGARWPALRALSGRGLATGADSLVAVKKLVYDWQLCSLAELRDVLADDYRGHEALRQMAANRVTYYGNDDPEADGIARRIMDVYREAAEARNAEPPGFFGTIMFSYTQHIDMGATLGATPNARRRGEPISNGVGPTGGCDRHGPTALIHSVAAIDHANITAACAFNLTVSASHVGGAEGAGVLEGLLRTYIARGGCQVQVNFVDRATLADALAHPERHRNLIVRVGGYSEYFGNLDARLQREVVERTAHGTQG